jgi:NADH dehydrogenase
VSATLLVTGANGHLGRRLCARVADGSGEQGAWRVRALVRSERAAATLRALPPEQVPEIEIVDYTDADQVASAAAGCTAAIHLVGILKETRTNRYADAHERPCEALAAAADRSGLHRIVALSILGAAAASPNACLASRARAEAILLAAKTPAVVIRVPMVLGAGDAASAALLRLARGPSTRLVRGGATLEQPIAAADVVEALLAGAARDGLDDALLDLAGPESLPHHALVRRAAALLGTEVSIGIVPGWLARSVAIVAERVAADPPITSAMLGVLEHDDAIDPEPARAALGITLTPLDDALRAAFEEEATA